MLFQDWRVAKDGWMKTDGAQSEGSRSRQSSTSNTSTLHSEAYVGLGMCRNFHKVLAADRPTNRPHTLAGRTVDERAVQCSRVPV
jgi:hypothetical protein